MQSVSVTIGRNTKSFEDVHSLRGAQRSLLGPFARIAGSRRILSRTGAKVRAKQGCGGCKKRTHGQKVMKSVQHCSEQGDTGEDCSDGGGLLAALLAIGDIEKLIPLGFELIVTCW